MEKNQFDDQFTKLIESIIDEKGYVKRDDLKQFIFEVLDLLNERISQEVKKHLVEICTFGANKFSKEE